MSAKTDAAAAATFVGMSRPSTPGEAPEPTPVSSAMAYRTRTRRIVEGASPKMPTGAGGAERRSRRSATVAGLIAGSAGRDWFVDDRLTAGVAGPQGLQLGRVVTPALATTIHGAESEGAGDADGSQQRK